jgi:hypothetical protein
MEPKNKKKKQSQLGADAASLGTGTSIIILANCLHDDNPFKIILLLVAPTLTLIFNKFFVWSQYEIFSYIQEKKLKNHIGKTQNYLKDALNNPDTTKKHREKIRKKIEEIEIVMADIHISRIKTYSTEKFIPVEFLENKNIKLTSIDNKTEELSEDNNNK